MIQRLFILIFSCCSLALSAQDIYDETEWGNPVDKKWYSSTLEGGYGLPLGDNGRDFIQARYAHGYYFTPHMSVELGAGLKEYLDGDSTFLPVFASLRAKFDNGENYPFFRLTVGYSLNMQDNYSPVGFFVNPMFGYIINPEKRLNTFVAAGFDLQQMTGLFVDQKVNYGKEFETTITSSTFFFSFGFMF